MCWWTRMHRTRISRCILAFDDVEDADTDLTYEVTGNTNTSVFSGGTAVD